jgi:hypothetical protein
MSLADHNPSPSARSARRWRQRAAAGRGARRRSGGCRGRCWPRPCAAGHAAPRRCRPWWPAADGSRAGGCSRSRRPACGRRAPRRWWSPRSPQAAHRRAGARCPRPPKDRLGQLVELADAAEGEAAQPRPHRGGGHHRWPSTLPVDPVRSSSTSSSMQSPPATIAWTTVSSLRPGRAAPGRSPRSSAGRWPARSPAAAPGSRAAAARRWPLPAGRRRRPRPGPARHGRVASKSSGSGIMTAWQPSFSLVRGPFSPSADHHRITDSVDRG